VPATVTISAWVDREVRCLCVRSKSALQHATRRISDDGLDPPAVTRALELTPILLSDPPPDDAPHQQPWNPKYVSLAVPSGRWVLVDGSIVSTFACRRCPNPRRGNLLLETLTS